MLESVQWLRWRFWQCCCCSGGIVLLTCNDITFLCVCVCVIRLCTNRHYNKTWFEIRETRSGHPVLEEMSAMLHSVYWTLVSFSVEMFKRIKEAAGQSVRSDKCVDGRSVNGLMSRWLWHQWTQCASCLSRAPQGYFPLQFISSFFVSLKKNKQKQSDCHDRKCFGAALWTLAAGWQLCFVLNVANKNGIRSST